MKSTVYISGVGALSSAGGIDESWQSLLAGHHCLSNTSDLGYVGKLPSNYESMVSDLEHQKDFRSYDRVCLLALLASREASYRSDKDDFNNYGTIYGSSRGATTALEQQHNRFVSSGRVDVLSSPTTTAGTLSATVAKNCIGENAGLSLSVSSACSTGLHTLGVGYGMIKAGMMPGALVGGAEAANTAFTLRQLSAARVYDRNPETIDGYLYRPYSDKRSGMILGEGAASLILNNDRGPVIIKGYGAATEVNTMTGITGDGLRRAMIAALKDAQLQSSDIDVVIGHGAGTRQGDLAEIRAYQSVFSSGIPPLTSFKWMTGHMLGASAAFSLAIAAKSLQEGSIPMLPYDIGLKSSKILRLTEGSLIMVCALGFGGNAGVVILGHS